MGGASPSGPNAAALEQAGWRRRTRPAQSRPKPSAAGCDAHRRAVTQAAGQRPRPPGAPPCASSSRLRAVLCAWPAALRSSSRPRGPLLGVPTERERHTAPGRRRARQDAKPPNRWPEAAGAQAGARRGQAKAAGLDMVAGRLGAAAAACSRP